ncbi:hypothetical protein F0562_017054 [Nyssa sinensis]|uniref:Fe2OG dioxygenase domain-containing protein n=1 Tax=Nyssa sinensis TaxID=561372 RepID=A0A5J4ZGX6_9ASTE|nr:hypothetical protein F0562_017054 [Nyssa sinensis]
MVAAPPPSPLVGVAPLPLDWARSTNLPRPPIATTAANACPPLHQRRLQRGCRGRWSRVRVERGKFKELGFSDSRLFMGHCYPFCPQPDLTIGIRSHSDYALMAVLLQNQVPGLQIKHGDGWVDVKPLRGGLIINIGDSLQIISNDEYKSVEHRVLANSSKEPRISTVEFFHADNRNGSACYGPLLELLSPEKPAIYRNFTMKEFLEIFYTKGVHSKSLVKELKL